MRLTVATLNVCGLPSPLRPLRERAPRFCEHFEDAGYDVVNLQEVWTRGQLRVIRAHLPSYRYVSLRRGIGGQPAGGLVTFSRRPVAGTRYTSFSGATAAGSRRFRARQWLNTRLQGALTTRLAEVPVAVGNTHLTANHDGDWSDGNRHYPLHLDQLERVHAAMDTAGADLTVLCGDFNVASSSSLYNTIRADYRDPFADTDPWTFHAELLFPGRRPHRIDYLLVRGDAQLCSYQTFFDKPLPGFGLVTDHVGLTAELELR
jgi:endonuclease/exonuclease/phosphatase family metal-dependent hydrolase